MSPFQMSLFVTFSVCMMSIDTVFSGRNRGKNGHNSGYNADCDCAQDIGNGCSVSDMAWINNFVAEFPFLVTDSQNAGNTTDELISFAECNMLYDLNYSIVAESNTDLILFGYNSLDEMLYGNENGVLALPGIQSRGLPVDTVSFVQGSTWLYGTTAFTKCYDDYAVNTFRSGDNVRVNNGINEAYLSISEYTFRKVAEKNGYDSYNSDDSNPSCSSKWKVSNVVIKILVSPFIRYNTTSEL